MVVCPGATFVSPLRRKVIIPVLERFFLEFHRRGTDQDEFAEFVADFHDFVQADAAFVSGVVACGTAAAVINCDLFDSSAYSPRQ